MRYQLDDETYEQFLKDLNLLIKELGDEEVRKLWGIKDQGNFSSYFHRAKRPGRTTVRRFYQVFKNRLMEIRKEPPVRIAKEPGPDYNNPIPLLKKHDRRLKRIEDQLAEINKTIKALGNYLEKKEGKSKS